MVPIDAGVTGITRTRWAIAGFRWVSNVWLVSFRCVPREP